MNVLLRNRSKILKYADRGVPSCCSYCKIKTTSRQHCLHGQKRTYGSCRVLPYRRFSSLAGHIYTKPTPLASSSFFDYDRVCNFSLSQRLLENPSSKVEVTVQSMKNKQKEKVEDIIKDATNVNVLKKDSPTEIVKPPPVKKSLKLRIWEEVLHYYHGFRLLVIDINICRQLLWRVLNGNTLTRRENRLLVRTTSDLFRLIPFSVFIIVPFMELLLPVFIKFFPGMLPSTFQTSKEREDKLKQNLQVRLEMAKFLQKTLDEMAVQHKDHKSAEAKQFVEFFAKIKDPNEYVPADQIIKFSKHFADEITLDSLSREQLVALCRVLELNTMGTTNLLRFLLRIKLRSLAADDRVIAREGVNALDLFELQQACKSRGMRAYGLTAERLRSQLQEWIDLSLNEKVPPTLLLLSRAMLISDDSTTTDKLAQTIRVLPDSVAAQTKAAIGESEGKIDNKTKIQIIKEEERKIKEEREEQKAQEKANKEKVLEKEKEKEQREILLDKAPVIATDDIRLETIEPTTSSSAAPALAKLEPAVEPTAEEGGTISSKDVEILSEALKTLSSEKKNMPVEKETIKDLKEELEDYKEDIEELREVRNVVKEPVHESRAAKLLFKKVNSMIGQLDKVLVDLEKKHQLLIEQKTGTVSPPAGAPVKRSDDELIRIDELVNAIKKVKQVSDESRLKQIEAVLSKLDTDRDGVITVDEVLKVVEAIGRDNIALDAKQLEDLLTLLDKEQIIEAEEKIEKAIAKSMKEAQKIEQKAKETAAAAAEELKVTAAAEELKASVVTTDELKDKAPELKDKAPELKDKAKDLSDGKTKSIVKDEILMPRKETSIMAEAAKIHAEKLLPTTEVPPNVLPPALPSAPAAAKKSAN